MSRIKYIKAIGIPAFIICASLFSGCTSKAGQEPVKKVEEMLNFNVSSGSETSEVYNTVEVTTGDIHEIEAALGSVSFPISYNLSHGITNGTVAFKNYNITILGSTFVTEGEIIATLELIIDPIAKEEANIKYEKALQSYENALERKNKDLENLMEDIEDETNTYQKQILELDYEVALEEYNTYIEEQTEYLAELKENVDLYNQESTDIYITAPCDGILSAGRISNSAGAVVAPDAVLATIYSLEEIVVVASRTTDLKYGNNVELTISSVTPAITLQGTVISASNLLYNAPSLMTTIKITSALPDFSSLGKNARERLSILARNTFVEDDIIIPSSALSNVKGNTGTVYVLENGTLTKKNVKFGYKGSDYTWILEGLEPGQKVTVK
ncbi:MAG: hypothetical protein E7261_02420 [Lachnospiraceae bacterium]|nr:hypothetical protein [Lachnospiraceae bacterium]